VEIQLRSTFIVIRAKFLFSYEPKALMSTKHTLAYWTNWLWPAMIRQTLGRSSLVVPLPIRHAVAGWLWPKMRPFLSSFDEHRCIFVHIPKNAGSSVSRSLGIKPNGHTGIWTYQMIFSPEEFRNYFKFAVVRNPWDRVLSAFLFLKNGGISKGDKQWQEFLSSYETFDDFVRLGLSRTMTMSRSHFRPQRDYICVGSNPPAMDFICYYEDLDADFRYVCEKLNINAPLLKLNVTESGRRDYKSYYTEETRRKVAELYADDIRILGYSFDNSNLPIQLASRDSRMKVERLH